MDRFEQSREGRRASIHWGIISSTDRDWGTGGLADCVWTRPATFSPSPLRPHVPYGELFGGSGVCVCVPRAAAPAHFFSIAARMSRTDAPDEYICCASRATSRHTAQSRPCGSHSTTSPARVAPGHETILVALVAGALAPAEAGDITEYFRMLRSEDDARLRTTSGGRGGA